MTSIRPSFLIFVSTVVLAGCSQAPLPEQADLQQRLTAAEARATAAEKRAKNAEELADQHKQEPMIPMPVAAPPPEIAEGGGDFGQPMNDTAPIEPVPMTQAQQP